MGERPSGSARTSSYWRAAEARLSEKLLLRFVQALFVQLGQTIASSPTQSVETRLSCWAVMAHDRVEGDKIKITHSAVALMLAVRRAP
jgi:hypothetical protein